MQNISLFAFEMSLKQDNLVDMFLLFTVFTELKYGFQKSHGLKNIRVLGKRPLNQNT